MTELITLPRSTVQQALEALEKYQRMMLVEAGCQSQDGEAAIDTFRAALEKTEQQPLFVVEGGELRPLRPALLNEGDKLYTHPPRREWRKLTEEEIRHFAWNGFLMAEGTWDKDTEEDLLTFARAIESALKEKNHE